MNDERVREMVANERARIEVALRDLTSDVRAEGALARQQIDEAMELGTDLQTEGGPDRVDALASHTRAMACRRCRWN